MAHDFITLLKTEGSLKRINSLFLEFSINIGQPFKTATEILKSKIVGKRGTSIYRKWSVNLTAVIARGLVSTSSSQLTDSGVFYLEAANPPPCRAGGQRGFTVPSQATLPSPQSGSGKSQPPALGLASPIDHPSQSHTSLQCWVRTWYTVPYF
jgi:hypothetical protein